LIVTLSINIKSHNDEWCIVYCTAVRPYVELQ